MSLTEYIGELENEDEIKSYLKEILIKDKNKLNKIKQIIVDIESSRAGASGTATTHFKSGKYV